MAKANELITKIILKGQTDPSFRSAFAKASKQAEGSINKLKSYGQTMGRVAKVGATATVAGLGLASKAAIDYESAFAGVMKTVDETSTTTYEDLSKGIRNMSKEMPSSAEEIAKVAENAGQLGIKADDILKFSKVMVQLGETTNINSEEAAQAIAKLFNITGTSMNNVDRFGATLVHLGNNAATTENDIMNMTTRIASASKQVGLSEQEMLALATSLSSVGLEAEGGGTAISTVMTKIDKAVALNSKTLSQWSSLAGMSADKFKIAWEKDAYGALQQVIKGMGGAEKGGKNLNVILEELGITGIRESDTIKRLASASAMMGDMTNLANEAWDKNSALTKEAETRYATMAAKIQVLKNKFKDVAITVGEAFMPVLDKMMEGMNKIDFEQVGKSLASITSKIGDAIGFLMEHKDAIVNMITIIGGAFVGFKIGGFIATLFKVGKGIVALVKSFGVLKIALAFLGGPIGIVATAIGALIGIFVLLWNKSKGFREFFIGLWNKIKGAVSGIVNFFKQTIPKAFSSLLETIKNLPSKIWNFLVLAKDKVAQWGVLLWNKAKEIGLKFINSLINFFKQLPYKIGYVIGAAIGAVAKFGVALWNFVTTKVPQFVSGVIKWFATLPSKIWTWLVNAKNKVVSWGSQMISKAISVGSRFVSSVVNFIKTLPSRIWTWLTNTASKVVSWGSSLASKGRAAAKMLLNAVINGVKSLPSKMKSTGVNLVKGLWNGISSVKDWVLSKIKGFGKGILDGIKDFFKIKSPSRVMMALGKYIPQGFGNGIADNAKYAINGMKKMGGKVMATASKIKPTITTKARTVSDKVKKFATGGTVTTPQMAVVGDAPETIVPHGNTPRNRALLNEAAKGVGADTSQGNVIHINFAPVINGGNAEDNRKMIRDEEAEFERRMDAYFKKQRRLSFNV